MNDTPPADKATKNQDAFQVAESDDLGKIKRPKATSHIAIYKPYHMILLVAGICIFIAGVLIFVFSHQPERFLFLVANKKRFILALFMSITASCFVVYGSYGRRNLGIFISLIASSLLCYLPIHYKDAFSKEKNAIYLEQFIKSNKDKYSEEDIEKIRISQKTGSAVTELDFFKANIRYEEIQKLGASNQELSILSLVIENISDYNYQNLLNYFDKTLDDNVLLTNRKTKFKIKELPAVVLSFQYKKEFEQELKETFKIITNPINKTELSDVLYVTFNEDNAKAIPDKLELEKLTQQQQIFIYANALGVINEEEIIRSLRFFQKNEKLLYVNEILSKLNELLNMRDLEFKLEVARALDQWFTNIENYTYKLEDIDPLIAEAKAMVNDIAIKCLDKGVTLPDYFYTFTAKHQTPGGERILLHKWKKSPGLNEQFMISAASLAEKALIENIMQFDEIEIKYACEILSNIGSETSIPKLEIALKASNSEKNQQSIRSSIDGIKNRL